MNEYILMLKTKFGYSDEILKFLSELIPNLIKYYGEEYKDIILSALANCEIHFQSKEEDPKTFLNSYFDVDKEWKMPKLAGAFYHNEIKVKDNQVIAKPIIYLKRVNHFDFNNDKQVNTLIHEICHLIKGYGKIKIKNGKIIDSTGLTRDTYSYSQEKGVVEEKDDMVGIEEAINEVETAQILEMMTGRKQQVVGYKAACYSATRLLEHKDIAKVIRISQFTGDNRWIQYLGEEQSKILIENFDVLVKSMYFSFSDINTREKKEAFYKKMELAQDAIDNFVDSYCSKIGVENNKDEEEIYTSVKR